MGIRMKQKGGKNGMLGWILGIALAALVVMFVAANVGDVPVVGKYFVSSTAADLSPEEEAAIAEVTEAEIASCSGIASVNLLYDDKDLYVGTTDPAGNITVFDPISKMVGDDATTTTVPIKSNLMGLAGNGLGTPNSGYFAEEVEISSVCSDIDVQTKLAPTGTPTLTWVNDDGITSNTDANHESIAADSTVSPCVTVKAPSNTCVAKYGAALAVYYDQTYWSSFDSGDVEVHGGQIREEKLANTNATTSDQVVAFEYEGELCDGDRVTICFEATSDSSNNPGEDQGFVIEWLGFNKDLVTDGLDAVVTGLYDDKNNAIFVANATKEFFVA